VETFHIDTLIYERIIIQRIIHYAQLCKKTRGIPVGSCEDIFALVWDINDPYVFQTLNGAVVLDYNGDVATVTAPGGVQVIGDKGNVIAPADPNQVITLGWETIFRDFTEDQSNIYDPDDLKNIMNIVNRYSIKWLCMLP